MSPSRRVARAPRATLPAGLAAAAPSLESSSPEANRSASSARQWLLAIGLAAITLGVFGPAVRHGFVALDDYIYVTENRHVLAGLTWEGVAWAFTTTHANFWHPLTWLSLMLDVQIFGPGPAGFHVTNLLLHLASTLLLFFALARLTGSPYPSAFVAALFAVHPLHVESVAWISERKDVLSTCFMMLALWVYSAYAGPRQNNARPRGGGRAASSIALLVLFALGLMAKPMLVTLPFVLLLLDWWPLGRLASRGRQAVIEKLPLFGLAVVAGVVAFVAQRGGGAVAALEDFPLAARVANALTSCVTYIARMFWPAGLVAFYPYPQSVPVASAAAAFLLLAAVSAVVIVQARRRPYLAVGWFWYLGTLLPVSGLVQVGSHAMADRYSYVPLIGLFVMIAWLVAERAARPAWKATGAAVAACVIVTALCVTARAQVMTWKDTSSLWRHALAVAPDNYFAHNALGLELIKQGRTDEADRHFAEASRLAPGFPNAHNNLGLILAGRGQTDEAIAEYRAALARDPAYVQARINMGIALHRKRLLQEAVSEFSRAVALAPDSASARANLGTVLLEAGRVAEGFEQARRAVELQPDSAAAHFTLANALARTGELTPAIEHYTVALRLPPEVAAVEIHTNLGAALERSGRIEDAFAEFQAVLRASPDSAPAHSNLANLLLAKGQPADAAGHYRAAIAIDPGHVDALMGLGNALADLGRLDEAEQFHRRAVDLAPRSAAAHVNLANTLYQRGRLPDAMDHYERALDIEGPSADVHAALGQTCERLGRRADAAVHFQAALRLQAGHPDASAGLARLAAPGKDGTR